MPNQDLYNNIDTLVAITPQALSGTTDLTGEVIDLLGYDSCTFVLQIDAVAATSLDAQLLIKEDTVASFDSPATNVADADLLGTEAATAVAQTDDTITKIIGYVGSKRYVRADLTVTANNGTDVVSCVAILGHPKSAPVS